jgi:hypothetical protein
MNAAMWILGAIVLVTTAAILLRQALALFFLKRALKRRIDLTGTGEGMAGWTAEQYPMKTGEGPLVLRDHEGKVKMMVPFHKVDEGMKRLIRMNRVGR